MLEKYKFLIVDEGCLFIHDRVKDMIVSNAFGNVDVGSVKDVYEKLNGGA